MFESQVFQNTATFNFLANYVNSSAEKGAREAGVPPVFTVTPKKCNFSPYKCITIT